MFGSFCAFPIYGLVKIRQTCKLDICRLVNCWWDFFGTGLYIDIGKHVKEWQVQREHSTCTSFSVFLNLILIGTRFKSTFWSMHAWVAKFTASKIWNSQLHLWVNAVASAKIQACVWEWPTYMSRLWKWQDCKLKFTKLQVWIFEHDYPSSETTLLCLFSAVSVNGI